MADEAAPAAKPKRPWPSGEDLAQYEGHEEWPPRRWAWEFLRRNDRFRSACRSVKPKDIQGQKKIAQEFGLREFKDYRNHFGKGRRRPKFQVNHIGYTSNADSTSKRTIDSRTLLPGQVIVRFDLASMCWDTKAIEPQLRVARKVIEEQLAIYAKAQFGDDHVIQDRRPKSDLLIRHLRTLDLLRKKMSIPEIIGKLYPALTTIEAPKVVKSKEEQTTTTTRLTSQEIHQGHRRKIADAKHFADEGYRYLAARRKERKGKKQ